MSDPTEATKPSVLILGGINTVARRLAVYLCGNLGRDGDSKDPSVKVSVFISSMQVLSG